MRVLIVDDNIDAADSLALVLGFRGQHIVRTAYNGKQALELAKDFQPEFILLDIGMPEMNGFEVARCLRDQAETRHATLIALTGWGQEKDRQMTSAAGFDFHLVKPVNFNELLQLLAAKRDAVVHDHK